MNTQIKTKIYPKIDEPRKICQEHDMPSAPWLQTKEAWGGDASTLLAPRGATPLVISHPNRSLSRRRHASELIAQVCGSTAEKDCDELNIMMMKSPFTRVVHGGQKINLFFPFLSLSLSLSLRLCFQFDMEARPRDMEARPR